jgi:hypothetical protein
MPRVQYDLTLRYAIAPRCFYVSAELSAGVFTQICQERAFAPIPPYRRMRRLGQPLDHAASFMNLPALDRIEDWLSISIYRPGC